MVKRKRYRFRQGDVIDVEEFHDGRYGGPGTGRAKRAKPTEEQMRAVNAQNKVKRCRQTAGKNKSAEYECDPSGT